MIVHIYEKCVDLEFENGAVESYPAEVVEVADHRQQVTLDIEDGFIGLGSDF